MKRGVAFYKDVLGVPMKFDSPEWTEFDMHGVTLALHATDKMPKNLDQRRSSSSASIRPTSGRPATS